MRRLMMVFLVGGVFLVTCKVGAAAPLSFQSHGGREHLCVAGLQCDAVTNVIDVVKFVNVAFRGGDAGAEFCEGCDF